MTGSIALARLILGLLSWSLGSQMPVVQETLVPARTATILLDRQLVLFEQDGREANLALVSTGRPGHATPQGTFTVRYRLRNPLSSKYLVRMPYWVSILPSGEVGFHQAPGISALSRLGEPLSHGCIRLGRHVAPWVYSWLPSGSEVVIRGH